jgi:hypothetical protein
MAESPLSTQDTILNPPAGEIAEKMWAGREKAFQEAKARVREAAEAQRERAASALGGVAGALHRTASDLNAENETMGRYTDMAAERLDEVANYLRTADWNSVVEGAEDFARRQPAWFIGGAVAAGFLIARAVKNSGQPRPHGLSRERNRDLSAASLSAYGAGTEAGLAPSGPAAAPPLPATGGGVVSGEG